jgi:hypothetical protein
MSEEEDQEQAAEIILIKPPRGLKDMTREERRAWAYELHQRLVAAVRADELNDKEK